MDKNGPKTSKMIENCKLEPLKSCLSLNLELDNFGHILTIFDPQSPNILKTVTEKMFLMPDANFINNLSNI